jgi:hypothetical protein
VRRVAAVTLVAAVPAAVGGVIFWAAHGGTALTRAVAYAFWFAAALYLVALPLAGSRLLWSRTSLPALEGWVLGSAAVVLTVLGAAIDVAG